MSSGDEDTAKAGPDANASDTSGADGNGSVSASLVATTVGDADTKTMEPGTQEGADSDAGAGAGVDAGSEAGEGADAGAGKSASTGLVEDSRVDVGAEASESDGSGEKASLAEGPRIISSPSPATAASPPPSSRRPSPGPRALRRQNTFRSNSSASVSTLGSPHVGAISHRGSGAPPVGPRAALPRAGTFKLARGAAPERKEEDASSVGKGSSDENASSGDDKGLPRKSSALPRGQTFRATRPDKIAEVRAEGARGRRPVPRAGTFAFGHGRGPTAAVAAEQERLAAQARNSTGMGRGDLLRKASSGRDSSGITGGPREFCGMCGGCGGSAGEDGGGSGGGAPPWAPERLAKLTPRDREIVLRKVQAKEELGSLDRELREKRLADEKAREAERKRAEREVEADAGEKRSEEGDIADIDFEELDGPGALCEKRDRGDVGEGNVPRAAEPQDSDDLEDNVSQRRIRNVGRRSSLGVGAEEATGARIGVAVDSSSRSMRQGETQEGAGKYILGTGNGAGEGACDDSGCGQCEALEGKVRDLEDQLDVLRGVVALSSGRPGESTDRGPSDETDSSLAMRKPAASWKSKVKNAYFGGVSASSLNERSRLKEEVEALRKATDFLFTRLQEADARRVDAAAPRPAPSPPLTPGADLLNAAQLD